MADKKCSSSQYTVKVEQLSPLTDETTLKLATGNPSDVDSLKINRTQTAFNFAYVNYTKLRDALHAVEKLNGTTLNGTAISAKLHTASSKCSLPSSSGTQHTVKVDQLPLNVTEEDLTEAFSVYGAVHSVKINTTLTAFNYAYVNYADLEDAKEAAEHLNATNMWGTPILVKVHKPDDGKQPFTSRTTYPKSNQTLSGKLHAVKVEQLPNHVTKEMLSNTFSACGSVKSVKINTSHTAFNYAYVNYAQLQNAEEAVQKLNGAKLWGTFITVKLHNCTNHHNVQLRQEKIFTAGQSSLQVQRDEQYTLKIDHLSGRVTEKDLIKIFGEHGKLKGVKLLETQTAFNYAYIYYSNMEDAEVAVSEFDGAEQYGVAMSVKLHTVSNKCRKQSGDQKETSYSQNCTLKVEHVPKCIKDRDLWDVFTPFGHVKSVNLVTTETDFNFACISYTELQDAEAAAYELDGSTAFSDHPISVKVQDPGDAEGIIPASALCHNASLSTVKMLLCSKPGTQVTITEEDLQDIFCHCGKIKYSLSIIDGNPPYAYINFEASLEAEAACALDGKVIMEHLLKVKLVTKQVESMDIRKIPCDPLVGKLMFSCYKDQIEAVRQGVKVQLHKLNSAIKLSGDTNQMSDVEKKIQDLLVTVQNSIVKTTINLPCHHLPSFTNVLLESTIEKIETTHLISFKFINADGQSMPISEFVKQLSVIVQASKDPLQIVDFSSFLHTCSAPLQLADSNNTHTWWWENGKRGYIEYSSDVSGHLTQHFLSSPHVPLQLLIQTKSYKVDFTAMTQTNEASGFVRKIRCTKQTQPLSKNNCEHHPPHSLHIEVNGQFDSLDPAVYDLTSELEKLSVESKCELYHVDPIAAALLDITSLYCLEARVVSEALYMKGAKEYVDKVMLIVQKKCISYLKQIPCIGVPENWSLQTEKVVLVPIPQHSSEWNEVDTLFHLTLKASQITKLERIQNKWLWEKFAFAKQRLGAKNNGGQVNEMKLFHGTSTTDPKKIYKSEQGFDFRYSSQGLWGTGSYFAVNASYSDKYAYQSKLSTKEIILARVLIGDACHCAPDRSLKMPPLKACKATGVFENERYDSVTGHRNGSDIYVIYDHEKAYPTYLITYK